MRSYSIAIGLGVLVVALFSGILYADVFHGRDRKTGTMVSRTSVDTVTPDKGLSIGLKIIRVHGDDKVTLAFTSLDKDLKELDTSSAKLLVDAHTIPLTFKRYFAFTIHESLPPLHELWFVELDRNSITQIAKCKAMSIQISTASGIPIKRALRSAALSDVKEVLSGNRGRE